MYKRFKGSARNLIYAAGLIVLIIFTLLAQLMMELSLIIRMINLGLVFVLLYCAFRFIRCYTYGIRIKHSELCVARFARDVTIPVSQIVQVQIDGDHLHIVTLDGSAFHINLKDINEMDRKVIISLIKYYAPNL